MAFYMPSDDGTERSTGERERAVDVKDLREEGMPEKVRIISKSEQMELIRRSSLKKSAVDRTKLSAKRRRFLEKSEGRTAAGRGVFGEESIEPEPTLLQTTGQKNIRKGNSLIIMKRDGPAGRTSGYGGKGDTQCSAIDLLVGPQGSEIKEEDKTTGERISIDPDFTKDAARIYMSQKTDIDHNFGLCEGAVGCPTAKSAVGIKADGVRVIAREGIKLVTGTDKRNSQGPIIDLPGGIDLIAGNDDSELQPLVKGDNLMKALKELSGFVNQLNGVVAGFLDTQMQYNEIIMNHNHHSPFFGAPTSPSPVLLPMGMKSLFKNLITHLRDLAKNKANLKSWNYNYCSPTNIKSYICSRTNNTT